MKKLFYILAATLMVLASVSCTKKMVPLYLKGTTWVCDESGELAVIKFDTRRTFRIDVYVDGISELTIKYKVAEVIDDQVNFDFMSMSKVDEEIGVDQEGMLILRSRRDMDLVFTSYNWSQIDEDSRRHFYRDDKFNIWNYAK